VVPLVLLLLKRSIVVSYPTRTLRVLEAVEVGTVAILFPPAVATFFVDNLAVLDIVLDFNSERDAIIFLYQ
jgi:hypothetical protein